MSFIDILIAVIQFLVGLGVLLYGVHMIQGGLEKSFGTSIRKSFERLSNNTFKSAVLGFGITSALQSSTASTVMVLGFTSAGILSLAQATGMLAGGVLGATTHTLLLSFSAIKLTDILMLSVFVGTVIFLFAKNQKKKEIGLILIGFGLMFLSLYLIGQSTSALRNINGFDKFLGNITNPFLLILIGALFTAAIQSSLGTAAITITLVSGGVMDIQYAAFILFGCAIGKASTSVIASIGGNTSSKRVMLIDLLIRASGLIVIVPITIFVPWVNFVASLVPESAVAFIVFIVDVVYALVCLILTFILTKVFVKISKVIFKEKAIPKVKSEIEQLFGIDDAIIAVPGLALMSVRKSAVGLVEATGKIFHEIIEYAQHKQRNQLFVSEIDKDSVRHKCEVLSDFVNNLYVDLTENEIKQAQSFQNILTDCNRLAASGTKMRLSYDEFLEKNIKDERKELVDTMLDELEVMSDICVKIVKLRADGKENYEKDVIKIFEADGKINQTRTELKKANLEKLKKSTGENRIYYNVFYNLVNHFDDLSDIITKIALTSL